MKKYSHSGNPLTFLAPAALTKDVPYLLGVLVVIPCETFASGAQADAMTSGVFFSMPKATGEAWTAGAVLYWDNSAGKFTTTSTNNTKCGVAQAIAASGDTTGPVFLTGQC